MKSKMTTKVICVIVASLFFFNSIAYGLSPMPGSRNPGTQDEMYALGQKLFAEKRGPGAIDLEAITPEFTGSEFVGNELSGHPDAGAYIYEANGYGTKFVKADYSNPPEVWKNNPILKETDLVSAFKAFRDTQTKIPADNLDIKEGYFPVDEEKGELPIARIEKVGKDKYVLVIHTRFVQMWNDIRKNDVWFEANLGPNDRRTMSVAWGIFYRLAKHELADLRQKNFLPKSVGHISYNIFKETIDINKEEALANMIGGRYQFLNDAIWLWFLTSYAFRNTTRYNNTTFLQRAKWIFESNEAKELKLPLEFPKLLAPFAIEDDRTLAIAFACAINYNFFNRTGITVTEWRFVDPEFFTEYEERERARQTTGITETPIQAAGEKTEAPAQANGARLHRELTLANHIFMSIHAAFLFPYYIDRILATIGVHTPVSLTPASFAAEVISGLVFSLITGWIAIGWHERGHYIQSIKQITLNEKLLPSAQAKMKEGILKKLIWNAEILLKAASGKFPGIKKAGLSYYVDAPFNLSVAAAGPRASRNLSLFSLPAAALFITAGFLTGAPLLLYIGRVFLGLSVVGFIDFKFADPGHYSKFKAQEKGTKVQTKDEKGRWLETAPKIKDFMKNNRIQEAKLPDGTKVLAPWGFRNSGMGGKHTEKEYPESNVSMQEAMFIPLSASNYEEAQRMTVELQTRLMQIINKTEGCRVMGIGLEGGLATYITKADTDIVPEQKLWRLMKRAIEDLGYNKSGKVDVAIALDPAASELENNYREKFEQPDVVGMYLFWRSKEQVVMSREELFELYKIALAEGIPIVSIEDGFAEDDDAGWALLMQELGDKVFVIGDDLITTNDRTIEKKTAFTSLDGTKKTLINVALIKANQIGTLSETILAMLTSLGKDAELVVSHRSKSPNDDMEAQIALAAMAMGLKAGGGANTERLVKYGSIIKLFKDIKGEIHSVMPEEKVEDIISDLEITSVTAYEEATNAGIPTVGVKVTAGIKGSKRLERLLVFTGSTPLGTSAGTGEASHLVDSIIEKNELTQKYPDLFKEAPGAAYVFKNGVTKEVIAGKDDAALSELWNKATRYGGKGCLNAVSNVEDILSKLFLGKKVSELKSVANIDNILLNAELELAMQRGKIDPGAPQSEKIKVMQYKGNLGMNAILSLSLALTRLLGALDGKDLWQVMREQMTETMAKTILANGGLNNIKEDALRVKAKAALDDNKNVGKEEWQVLTETMGFEGLVKGLQEVDRATPDNVKLYELLRKELPVYEYRKEQKIEIADIERTFGLPAGAISKHFPSDQYLFSLEPALDIPSSSPQRILGILHVVSKANPDGVHDYLIKSSNKPYEGEAAEYASQNNMGPGVLYQSPKIIVEELLPPYDLASRGMLLSIDESKELGKILSEKFYNMAESKKYMYIDRTPQTHIFILGSLSDENFDIRFTDWSQSFFGKGAVSDSQNQVKTLKQFAFITRAFLSKPTNNVIAWAVFETRLLELASKNGDRAYYKSLIDKLRRECVSGDLNRDGDDIAGWIEFFKAVDSAYVFGSATYTSVSLGEPGKSRFLVSFEDQAKRSLELILSQSHTELEPPMAQAIVKDLFERGYLGEDLNITWNRILDQLESYLSSKEFDDLAVGEMQKSLQRLFPAESIIKDTHALTSNERMKRAARMLPGFDLQDFADYLVQQKARRITIRSASLPNLRNRQFGDVLELFYDENPGRIIKQYVIKKPHSMSEAARSRQASTLGLGPQVIYTRNGNTGGYASDLIIEDFLPPERNIRRLDAKEIIASPQATIRLAENTALAIHRMIDPNRKDAVLHRFDNSPEHIFILDKTEDYAVLMIDWAKEYSLGYKADGSPEDILTAIFKNAIVDDFKKLGADEKDGGREWFRGFWSHFKAVLINLERTNNSRLTIDGKEVRLLDILESVFGRVDSMLKEGFLAGSESGRASPPSDMSEHSLITEIIEFKVRIGKDAGPGSIKLGRDEILNIWQTVKLFDDGQIEVFQPQGVKLTEMMKKALSDIRERKGTDVIKCREYSDASHLGELLKHTPEKGVKRIVLTTEQLTEKDPVSPVGKLAEAEPQLFQGVRLFNIALPEGYAAMPNKEKTFYQARMIMEAILVRLYEKDKTPMIGFILNGMLKGCVEGDIRQFLNGLVESDDETTNSTRIKERVIYCLGKTVSLIAKLAEEIEHLKLIMKEFWTAA